VHRLAPLFVLLALVGCGGGGGDDGRETAAEFATRVVGLLEDARPGQAWDELHPVHREHVPRALYVRCEGKEGLGGEVTNLQVEGVHDERASVPGLGDEPSTDVVLKLMLRGEHVKLDMHVFDVDGEWAWVIGAHDYAAYAAGRCP
jgi:hypothetical protein